MQPSANYVNSGGYASVSYIIDEVQIWHPRFVVSRPVVNPNWFCDTSLSSLIR